MMKTIGSSNSNVNHINTTSSSKEDDPKGAEDNKWEMRPGGMMVQKRNDDVTQPPAIIRVRIVYGGLRYEIAVSCQATFGEVKKIIKGELITGLEVEEQKVIYKGKERGNGEYLDICGVSKGSKLVVVQDPASIERRYIEMKKKAKIQTSISSISSVSIQLDDLSRQVSAIEKSISNGKKVAEIQITTLTEMLMRQAIKLDSISTHGSDAASTLKNIQGKRVQKYVESLDMLKISNAKVKPLIVTTKWETFDFEPPTQTQWNLLD